MKPDLLVTGTNPVAQVAGPVQYLQDTGSGRVWLGWNGSNARQRDPLATLAGAPVVAAADPVVVVQFQLFPFASSIAGLTTRLPVPALPAGKIYQTAGTGGADVIAAQAAENRLFGDGGSDSMTSSSGADLLNGGGGADFLCASSMRLCAVDDNRAVATLNGGTGVCFVQIDRGDMADGGTGTDILRPSDALLTDSTPPLANPDCRRIEGDTPHSFGHGATLAAGPEAVLSCAPVAAASRIKGTAGSDEIGISGDHSGLPGTTRPVAAGMTRSTVPARSSRSMAVPGGQIALEMAFGFG